MYREHCGFIEKFYLDPEKASCNSHIAICGSWHVTQDLKLQERNSPETPETVRQCALE